MKTDYPELEGKIIIGIDYSGKEYKLKVIGCNLDVGITLVYADEPERFALCFHGPSSPLWKKHWKFERLDKVALYASIAMIKTGRFYESKINKIFEKYTKGIPESEIISGGYSNDNSNTPSAETCPYGQ